MSKLLGKMLAVMAIFLFSPTANAALINITDDHTTANAQVTYDPGVVSNPGTTLASFSGQIFPSATFSGFSLIGDRSAIIPITGEFFDTTSYSAVNHASLFGGFYRFVVTLGTSEPSQFGATGSASAETDLKLSFQVTGGNTIMDMFAAYEGNAPVSLSLYDDTLGTMIELLAPTSFGIESADGVVLLDNHHYTLLGDLFAFTPLSGDPSSNFGFRFHDDLALAPIPEPGSFGLFILGILAIAGIIHARSRQYAS